MFNIKSVSSALRNLVTKYKAQRAKDVVDAYIGLVDASIIVQAPMVLNTYQAAAHALVDKTFEKPEVLANLVDAVDAALAHYGPALGPIVKQFTAVSGEMHKHPMLKNRIAKFEEAMDNIDKS